MWSARTSAPTCLEAPVVCAHTLKHTYACFSHGRTCQPADVWHHALSEEEVFPPPVLQCVCVCVCVCARRRKTVVIMTYGLDSSFLLGREDRNGYTEECSGGGLCRKDDMRREFKESKEMNLHQPAAAKATNTHTHTHTQGEEMSEDKTPGGPPCLHFPLCQSVPPPVVFISDTAGNASMTHRSLKCCEPHFARGGGGEDCGSDSKSCLIIPATITTGTTNSTTAAADSL